MALAGLPDLEKVGQGASEFLQPQRTDAGRITPRAIFPQHVPYIRGSRCDGHQARDGKSFGLTHQLGFVPSLARRGCWFGPGLLSVR